MGRPKKPAVNASPGSTGPNVPAEAQPVSPSVLKPEHVIQHYDSKEWEQFVLEYLGAEEPRYGLIEPKGGAGDKGRDILAHCEEPPKPGPVDIFQCKAYDHALYPGDVWVELGKLVVYTHRGDYPVPRRYRFVAPRGIGTALGDLLKRPDELRRRLVEEWSSRCESGISEKERFPLEGELKLFLEGFDFSVVGYIPVHELLRQHNRTPQWGARFPRDTHARPPHLEPPAEIQATELRYTKQLLEAYQDHLKAPMSDVESLGTQPSLLVHFRRARADFFKAEGLNRFYRDQFPEGAFDDVKGQVFDGVVETAEGAHDDGLARVRKTLEVASVMPLAQTDYTPCVEAAHKKGLCHHLANDDRLHWVKP